MKAQAIRGVTVASSPLPRRLRATLLAGLLIAGLAPCAPAAAATSATVTSLHGFQRYEALTINSLVLGKDGNLYGSAPTGGLPYPNQGIIDNAPEGLGTIFQLTPAGACTVLYNFNYNTLGAVATPLGTLLSPSTVALTGQSPGPLAVGPDGIIQGSVVGTTLDGILEEGLINDLRLTPDLGGQLGDIAAAIVHSTASTAGTVGGGTFAFVPPVPGLVLPRYLFDTHQNQMVQGPLAIGKNGLAYGLLYTFAADGSYVAQAFKLTALNQFSVLHTFSATEGPPQTLMLAADGNLYGTIGASSVGDGRVFRLSTAGGALAMLHSFGGADGNDPRAALVQGPNGTLYGSTYQGGKYNYGVLYSITPAGGYALLHSFSYADGASPTTALLLGQDGNFYGTATDGGANAQPDRLGLFGGVLFELSPAGTYTKLYDFELATGSGGPILPSPVTPLVQAANGTLYAAANFAVVYSIVLH